MKQRAKERKTNELQNKYQIMMLVGDGDKFTISFQTPVKHVSFKKSFYYSAIWDF